MSSFFLNRFFQVSILASTDDVFQDFAPYVPSINKHGEVAFQAETRDGRKEVYATGNERSPRLLTTLESPLECVSHPVLNNEGQFCVYASSVDGRSGLLRSLNEQEEWLSAVDLHESFVSIGPLGPTMNSRGTLAFRAWDREGREHIACWQREGVQLVARTGTRWTRFFGLPVINEKEEVLFRAETLEGKPSLVLASGGQFVEFCEAGHEFVEPGFFPTLNDRSEVLFHGTLSNGQKGVFQWKPEQEFRCLVPGDGFESFRGALYLGQEEFLFYATPPGGTLGIYLGDNLESVVSLGDPFLGSTITEFALNPVSANQKQQFALRVRLKDGRQLILRVSL